MFKSFLLNRLKEPTTYIGLVAIGAGAFGMTLSDEHALTIASGLAMVIGTVLAAKRERKSEDHPDNRPVADDGVRGSGLSAGSESGSGEPKPSDPRSLPKNRNRP